MIELVAGANMPLPAGVISLTVSGPFDVSVLVTGGNGKVSGDGDFVFYNQPTAPGVRLTEGAVAVDPGALRRGAARVVVVASPEDLRTPFGRLPPPTLTVHTPGKGMLARFRAGGLTSETVVQLCEIYRHGAAWKVRAIGQGYANGLAGLAKDFGVDVDDVPAPAPPLPNAHTPAAPSPYAPSPYAPAARPGARWPASSGPATTRPATSGPAVRPAAADADVIADVVTLTNEQRGRHGLVPLVFEHRLAAAAQLHTDHMVARDFFAHDSPDGQTVADRVTAAGYRYSIVAENIAAGQRTPAEVVDGWMHSPGHRAKILNPDVRQIGVGLNHQGRLGTVWTQVFGTPL
jgi:uncharacterized protein YkwD/stress response protein SCP2